MPPASQVRSNIFISQQDDDFIAQYAKHNHLKKSEAWKRAVKLLRKEQMKQAMDDYYQDPESQALEAELAEESLSSTLV